MTRNDNATCIGGEDDSELLAAFIAGTLDLPERQSDRDTFYKHVEKCPACQETMIDHVNETVTIPLLAAEAEKLGLTLDEMFQHLEHYIDPNKKAK